MFSGPFIETLRYCHSSVASKVAPQPSSGCQYRGYFGKNNDETYTLIAERRAKRTGANADRTVSERECVDIMHA